MEQGLSKDTLTDFYPERAFLEQLDTELSRSKRYNRTLALLLMKFIPSSAEAKNYSHYQVLKKSSRSISKLMRKIDLPGRIGDKLALAIPETGIEGAQGMAKRILGDVKGLRFSAPDYDFGVACEIGVSLFPNNGETASALLIAAEVALEQKPIKG